MYEKCVKHYNLARLALLVMTVLTVVNIGWLIFDLDATSVFFAALPMMATRAGVMLYILDMPLYAVILCGVAVVLLLAAYVVCWALSKERGGWMIVATILYGVDLLAMAYSVISSFVIAMADGLSTDLLVIILSVLFEAVVMFFLFRGVLAKRKMKKIDQ